jgi:transcriptional regulator of acetoin/glycerol metabolism
MPDELADAVARAGDPDPAVALPALRVLREWADERESQVVRAARAQRWSWSQIAEAIGKARQSLWERYRE